jgi:hypothetical protein
MSNIGTLVGMSSAFSVGGVMPSDDANEPFQRNLIDGKCLTADTTTITLSAQDKYLTTSTGGYHRYSINGNPALTVANAGTFSASPGDKINVLWMNGTKPGYFSSVSDFIVPCSGTFTEKADLIANQTVTVRFFNSNGDLINGVGTGNQSLSAGDIKNVKTEIEGTYQKGFPYGFVAVVEFNKTSIDDVQLTSGGVELPSASVPQSHASTLGTESARKAYLISEINSNAKLELTTVIDADDTTTPVDDGSDVFLSLFPRNYFVNDKNGGAYEGPSAEDEYNAVTRTGQIASTLNVD